MHIVRTSVDGYTVTQGETLTSVLVVITNNHKGTAIVVDADGCYIGVVSDGDIRRALLKGATEFTPVEKLVNVSALSASMTDDDAALLELFAQHPGVMLVPLIGEGNIVQGVAFVDHRSLEAHTA